MTSAGHFHDIAADAMLPERALLAGSGSLLHRLAGGSARSGPGHRLACALASSAGSYA
jgi:hypothetical protein